jgi:hypothetical protein
VAGRVQGRVIDVTPRTRMQSAVLGLGLAIEITGWFLAAAAAIQGLGTALTVGLALVVILLGRRLRAMSV